MISQPTVIEGVNIVLFFSNDKFILNLSHRINDDFLLANIAGVQVAIIMIWKFKSPSLSTPPKMNRFGTIAFTLPGETLKYTKETSIALCRDQSIAVNMFNISRKTYHHISIALSSHFKVKVRWYINTISTFSG